MPTFIDVLSTDRFDTYLQWANGDPDLGVRLYTFNTQLSAALYAPLHMLEVALRNATDQALITPYGTAWLDSPTALPHPYQQDGVAKARQTLVRAGKQETHSRLVAELTFGFWTSLYGRDAGHLWQHLRPIFKAKGVQRPLIAGQLRDLRMLRNRVAHYEPVLAQPLAQRYASLTTLLGWLSPEAAAWVARTSTWSTTYPAVPVLVPDGTGTLRIDPAVISFLPKG